MRASALLAVVTGVTVLFSSVGAAGTVGKDAGEMRYYFLPAGMAPPPAPGVRVVSEYPAFTLIASPAVLDDPRAAPDLDHGLVYFSTGPRDPIARPLGADSLRPAGPAYYLVQFDGPIRETWRQELSRFGQVAGYVPNDALVLRTDAAGAAAASLTPLVRWVGHFAPDLKVDGRASRLASLPPSDRDTDAFRVVTFPGADLDIATLLGAPPVEMITSYETLIGTITLFRIAPAADLGDVISSLSRAEGVAWIEPAYPARSRNDQATWVIQTGQSNSRKLFDNGIKGDGQVAGVADDGQDTNHPAFKDPARPVQEIPDPQNPKPPDTAHRKVVNWWDFGGSKSASHGTSTSSIIAGSEPAGHQYDGMAPNAKLSMQAISFGSLDPISKFFTAAYGDGARTHSDSWGNDNGRYDAWAVDLDDYMWKNPDMQIQIAIANRGPNPNTVSSPESAKNCIATGATNHPGGGSIQDVESYSARGPAQDGRLKPDLLAPSRETAADAGTTNYGSAGQGTSFATPSMSGGITLIRQYYADGYYPSGKKSAGDAIVPSAALLKATAINSGSEMTGQGAHTNAYKGMQYPNVDQGWGRLTMDDALFFDGDKRKLWIEEEKTGLKTGDAKTYDIGVEGATEHLEITLVWTDYPGAAGPTRNLVNDLDLEATSPTGKVYKGNVFGTTQPYQSQEGGSADDLNNVENVQRFQPETGVWRVKVTGRDVPQGTQQRFALVATGELAPATGVQLVSPKGGEMLKGNATQPIDWTSKGGIQPNSVTISFAPDGTTWQVLASNQPANGSYNWNVPGIDSTKAKVRAEGKDASGAPKTSESQPFSIDGTTPASQVAALPAVTLQPALNLSISHSDKTSGIKEVDVQYRVEGGAWASAGKTNATNLRFNATKEGKHEFQSVATDNVGWQEAAPPQPDASTLVDLAPPTVTSSTPANNAKDVPIDTTAVLVRFSEKMDRKGVESSTSFEGAKARITGFSWANGTQEEVTATVDGFTSGETYVLIITSGAKDLASRPLSGAPWKLSFTMQVETVPPEVSSTSPGGGATEVKLDSSISVTFSEAMRPTQTQAAITFSPALKGNWSWDPAASTITLEPARPGLKKGQQYKVTISTAAQDRAGNGLKQKHEFAFTAEGAGIPGLPPLFTGGLIGFGFVGDLLLLIILVAVVVAAVAIARKRRRGRARPQWYGEQQGYDAGPPALAPYAQQPPAAPPYQPAYPQGPPPSSSPQAPLSPDWNPGPPPPTPP